MGITISIAKHGQSGRRWRQSREKARGDVCFWESGWRWVILLRDLLDPSVGPSDGDRSVGVAKVGGLGHPDKESDLHHTGEELDLREELRETGKVVQEFRVCQLAVSTEYIRRKDSQPTFSTLLICDSGKTASITNPPLSVTTGPEVADGGVR
jgi:hypothetical protein